MKQKKAIYLVFGLVFLFAFNVTVASAGTFTAAKNGGNITLSADQTIKNFYAAGNIISINGNIEKSLHAVGNVITVNGTVGNNLNAIGSTIIIRGNVGGSIHTAGGTVVIEGDVTDDLLIAGGNVAITSSAKIDGDLIIAGGTIEISAPVGGKLYVTGGELIINSKIAGKTNINVEKLTLGEKAEITQDLKYKAIKEAEINEAATILGTIDFTKSEMQKKAKEIRSQSKGIVLGILTIGFFIKLLILIVSGLILVYFFGNLTKPIVKEALTKFWPSLGVGFATLILAPVVAILLAITVVGLWLAGLIGTIYVLMLMLASPIASIIFGTWFLGVFNKKEVKEIGWQQVVIGAIVLGILSVVPLFGWLVGFAMLLVSLGALYRLTYKTVMTK
ncbi:hypothetical protein KKA15_02750 [Patescibacteria group bacterium]|nr:hypothetical protein [Patescibacteria group bacterium]